MKKRSKEEAREYMRLYRARRKERSLIPAQKSQPSYLASPRNDVTPSRSLQRPTLGVTGGIFEKPKIRLKINLSSDCSHRLIDLLHRLGYRETPFSA